MPQPSGANVQREPLSNAVQQLIEECRMVLPGIQALFGFQLIAVFNEGFSKKLTPPEQTLHLAAIGLTALAIALVMTPASYHRQTEPETISRSFITIASRLLLCSMFPLAIGTCLDFYLIAKIILHDKLPSLMLALSLGAVFGALWLVLPRARRLQNLVCGHTYTLPHPRRH